MKSIIGLAFTVAVTLACIGCGGGSSGNPNLPTSRIDATTTIAGVAQAWVGAYVSGDASSYNCDPGTDQYCNTKFANEQTDSQGHYYLSTDAIPGGWGIGVAADSNCSTGASFSGQISASVDTSLICGQINPTYPAVSPSACTKTTWVNRDTHGHTTTDNCPSQVTLTTSSPQYPTTYALSVIGYNDAGTQVASSSVSATSSTSITMPTPTQAGFSVLVIRDPTNNNVLGSSLFDYVESTQYCYTNGSPTCPN